MESSKKKIEITIIHNFLKEIYLQKNGPNTIKVIFCNVIGCSMGYMDLRSQETLKS